MVDASATSANNTQLQQLLQQDLGALNLYWALQLVHGLVLAGVENFVISPGSRSTPLALAVARHPQAKYQVIIDERSAAFFALGQAKNNQKPSTLICTSGTAVANWLPAVVEANHSATPMILLSADRPPELIGRAANQTIDQTKIFGDHVRAFHNLPTPEINVANSDYLSHLAAQAMHESQFPLAGPVHLNIPLREPLLPNFVKQSEKLDQFFADLFSTLPKKRVQIFSPLENRVEQLNREQSNQIQNLATQINGKSGWILCGSGNYPSSFQKQISELAERLNAPIFADAQSNLRWGNEVSPFFCSEYDQFLAKNSETGKPVEKPEWILQFGRPLLSKNLNNAIKQAAPETFITICNNHLWPDPDLQMTHFFPIKPDFFCTALVKALPELSESADKNPPCPSFTKGGNLPVQSETQTEGSLTLPDVMQVLQKTLPANTQLFCANSTAIRELDRWFGNREEPLQLFTNRGASGIDGNLSTLFGIASNTDAEIPVVGIIGDVTFYHDLNALKLAKELNRNITILLINNGGGQIFSQLSPQHLPHTEFEKIWLTPTNLDFLYAAKLFELEYHIVENIMDFKGALHAALEQDCCNLIELKMN